MKHILHITLVAGGTGGHMMPAEAVSRELTKLGHVVSLITDRRGDSFKNIMPTLPRTVLKTGHMSSVGFIGKMQLAVNLFRSFLHCRAMMKNHRPDVVVGFGGYPSLPAVRAASSLGIATALHEQNAVLGRSNRVLAKKCDAIALSFHHTARMSEKEKAIAQYVGNPIRDEISLVGTQPYSLPFKGEPFSVLVIGGSQGARILSQVVPAAIAALSSETRRTIKVHHQARQEDLPSVKNLYEQAGVSADVLPYFADMARQLKMAHLVISRAGASSVTEIAAAARPAIFIPLPSATDDHQTANAKSITVSGGGWLMPEHDFSAEALTKKLEELIADPSVLSAVSQNARQQANTVAAARFAELIIDVATKE